MQGSRTEEDKNTKLAEKSATLSLSVPTLIPKDKFSLTPLSDGFKLEASHEKKDEKGKEGTCTVSSSFLIEEHYGRPVKEVRGEFKENGKYSVCIEFTK